MTRLQRNVNMAAVVVPLLIVVVAVPLLWGSLVGPSDLAVFAVMYVVCGLGVTVGYHRMLTHRAFQTHRATRYVFAVLGSMAVQGPVIDSVADHRKHHAHTDEEGDPHSPHVGHGAGVRGALRGLWHAHAGWLWRHAGPGTGTQLRPRAGRGSGDAPHQPAVPADRAGQPRPPDVDRARAYG